MAAPVQLEGLTPATSYMVEFVLVFRGGGTGPPLMATAATLGDGEEGRKREGGREGGRERDGKEGGREGGRERGREGGRGGKEGGR